jgi:two-component system response regulator CpxR
VRLLIIDDDRELCALLGELLARENLQADFVHDGQAGLKRLRKGDIDLVVLDVMLPGIDGFELLGKIRSTSNVPVIMLTARGEDSDRILGLELGADDYLSKPFNGRELIARIRAVFRRLRSSHEEPERLEIDGLVLESASREVYCEGRQVRVTTLEFEILKMLMQAAGRVLTRDHIMELLYNREAGPLDRSIDLHISHLRRKLGQRGQGIRTVRGAGYQFARRFGKDGESPS